MRARLFHTGAGEFSDHELLEILLYYAVPRVNTNPAAHRLIEAAGGLGALTQMPPEALKALAEQVEDCPSAMPQTVGLVAAFEQTYLEDKCNAYVGRVNINDARSVTRVALELCAGDAEEVTRLICTDNRMSVKCVLPLCPGRPDSEKLFGEIVRLAVSRGVSCVILTASHSDGNAAFTREEIQAARALHAELKKAGIRLLDVILCCDGNACRLSTTGLLDAGPGWR